MNLNISFNPIFFNDKGSLQSAKDLIQVYTETDKLPIYYRKNQIGAVDIQDINFKDYEAQISINDELKEEYCRIIEKINRYELCIGTLNNDTRFEVRPRKNNLDGVKVDNLIILGMNTAPLSNLTERQLKIISEEVKFKYIKETEFIIVDIDLVDGNAIVATPYKYGAEILDKNLRVCVTLEEGGKTVFDVVLVDKERLTFTQALTALDKGKIITREKWINENIYLINIQQDAWKVDFPFKSTKIHSHFIAKVVKDFIMPWNFSVEEIGAKDYIILDKDEIN